MFGGKVRVGGWRVLCRFLRYVFELDSDYIKRSRRSRLIGTFSIGALLVIVTCAVFPIADNTEQAEAAVTPATTTLGITSVSNIADVVVDLSADTGSGVFAASTSDISFDVATNNLTGYTLKLVDNGNAGKLLNSDYNATLDTITSITDATTFATGAASTYANKWGFKPDKYNSATNDKYIPAPTTSDGYTLNTTNCASGKGNCSASDTYNIGVGARVDYTKPAGEYMNTYTLVALANSISFQFNFKDNSPDSTAVGPTLPDTDYGEVASASVFILPTKVPTRTGYDFIGWCKGTVTHVTSGDSGCEGTIYSAGDDYTNITYSSNVVDFYAMWSAKTYSCVIYSKSQNADGSYATAVKRVDTTKRYGQTCSWSFTATDAYKAASYSTTVTGNINNSSSPLAIDRKSYACIIYSKTQNADGSYAAAVKRVDTTKLYGATCSWSFTATAAYKAATFSKTVDQNGVNNSSSPLEIKRQSYTCLIYSKSQNANGTYADPVKRVDTTKLYGAACSWSFTATDAYKAASYSKTVDQNGVNNSSSPLAIDRKSYKCYKRYRLQGADGNFGDYTTETTTPLLYGATCSAYTKTLVDYKASGGSNGSSVTAAAATVTGDTYLSLSFYRNTYQLTVTKDSTYIDTVTGAGTYIWDYEVPITATAKTNMKFGSWTQTAGSTNGKFTNASAASTKFKMPKNTATVKAGGCLNKINAAGNKTMQNYAAETGLCDGAKGSLTDSRDSKTYTVAKIGSYIFMTRNLRLAGGKSISDSDSNLKSGATYKLPSASDAGDSLSYTAAKMYNGDDATEGHYYNYCTASAGTICVKETTSNDTYNICPKGWTLPTKTQFNNIKSRVSDFNPNDGWYVGSGGFGDRSRYWTRTSAYDDPDDENPKQRHYRLYYNGESLASGSSYRDKGEYIRCVLK